MLLLFQKCAEKKECTMGKMHVSCKECPDAEAAVSCQSSSSSRVAAAVAKIQSSCSLQSKQS